MSCTPNPLFGISAKQTRIEHALHRANLRSIRATVDTGGGGAGDQHASGGGGGASSGGTLPPATHVYNPRLDYYRRL